MKKNFFLIVISILCMLTNSQAQRFQVTTGTTIPEEKWAVIEDSALAGYVTIGNVTNSAGISQLWITRYSATGVVVSSARATTNRKMIARDISAAPSETNGGRTFYVTGWTQTQVSGTTTFISQMFIGRIRLNGSFVWYKEGPLNGQGNAREGVAVASAPNGDAVAAGNIVMSNPANGVTSSQVMVSRFTSAGAIVWTNAYNRDGNWMVREIAPGVPVPNCASSPAGLPGEFVITGEASIATASGGPARQSTFAAVYNGAGTECWRSLFPASAQVQTAGDAGYDVVYNPGTGRYAIAGVAQLGAVRASASSTPYLLEITTSGIFATAAIYLSPTGGALGLYPRCLAVGAPATGAVSSLIFAGPDYSSGKTFYGAVSGVGAVAQLLNYNGLATASSVTQPLILNDARPEGILYTKLGTAPGYLISTNASPGGAFGNGDGHLIRTDMAGRTPEGCAAKQIPNQSTSSQGFMQSGSVAAQQEWGSVQPLYYSYAVQQRFCRDTCTVTAAFGYAQSGTAVNFTDSSSGNGSLSYMWQFGDSSTSTLHNPSHSYAIGGTYVVCLTVTNISGSGDTCRSRICQTILVRDNPNPCDIVAGFTYSVACKYKVTFTNTSTGTGPLTYTWYFDDGTTSTTQNPIKSFTKCGPHRTYLIVCNATCCDTVFVTVDIPCCEAKSDFCLQDSGLYVQLIYNTAMNLPATTYTVYLDGTAVTWTANTYKLLTAGTHNICLKARRIPCPGDTCCATCCKTIYVHAACTLAADFWHQEQTNGTVVFTNKTTPTGYTSSWNFGDASPLVTTSSPSHLYAPGTYTACLTTTLISGTDTCYSRICKTIVIDTPCKIQARFKTKYCISAPLSVDFTNYSFGATGYLWDFGDGNTSILPHPTHVYASPGSYYVCLYATAGGNCGSKVCYTVNVSNPVCNTSCTELPRSGNQSAKERSNEMMLESVVKENSKALKNAIQPEVLKHEEKLSLFPNPAAQKVQVVFEAAAKAAAEVTIVNALGSVVYKKSVSFAEGKNQLSIPIQSFADGNYFLKITSGSNIHSTLFSVKN